MKRYIFGFCMIAVLSTPSILHAADNAVNEGGENTPLAPTIAPTGSPGNFAGEPEQQVPSTAVLGTAPAENDGAISAVALAATDVVGAWLKWQAFYGSEAEVPLSTYLRVYDFQGHMTDLQGKRFCWFEMDLLSKFKTLFDQRDLVTSDLVGQCWSVYNNCQDDRNWYGSYCYEYDRICPQINQGLATAPPQLPCD